MFAYLHGTEFPGSSTKKETAVSDAIDLLKIRRSVKPREMSGPGPSPAELETILTIGARVPDHGELAPWRFIVFEGDARIRAGEIIAGVFARKHPHATPAEVDVEKRRLTDAPLVIGVVSLPHPKVPPRSRIVSGCQRDEHRHRSDGARLRRVLVDGGLRSTAMYWTDWA